MDEFLPTETLEDIVSLLIRLVELVGALVIFVGAVLAFVRFLRRVVRDRGASMGFSPIRLDLGRYLILGLEFQLASDVLRTAISPTFEDLLLLLFVAAIRTALNYILRREVRDEEEELAALRRLNPPPTEPALTPPPPTVAPVPAVAPPVPAVVPAPPAAPAAPLPRPVPSPNGGAVWAPPLAGSAVASLATPVEAARRP